jgi:hypothetical protein
MKHTTQAEFKLADTVLHEKCSGCGKANLLDVAQPCAIYQYPSRQWTRLEGCAARTHNKVVPVEDKKMVNPLKASRRSMQRK